MSNTKRKHKFGFIKEVDKGWITTVKDMEMSGPVFCSCSESWRFER